MDKNRANSTKIEQVTEEGAHGDSTVGVLLVGHGTRDTQGQAEFLALAKILTQKLAVPLAPCFLELAPPTIAEGLARLHACGVRQLICAPLLLFSAGHAKRDIPEEVLLAAKDYPGLVIRQSEPLGEHPSVIELVVQRIRAAAKDGERWTLVVVGRGSSDDDATLALQRLAATCGKNAGADATLSGFAAVQRPSIPEVLAAAVAGGSRNIVVHPHFLFMGQLWRDLERTISQWSAKCPDHQIVLLPPLGPAVEIAAAARDRIVPHL
jgi:sirohydrochlorin cobaltochelatase